MAMGMQTRRWELGQRLDWTGDNPRSVDWYLARGWKIQDGSNGTVNLIERFPKYQSGEFASKTGGSKTVTPSGSVSTSVANHTLSEAQMPVHQHTLNGGTYGRGLTSDGGGYNGSGSRNTTNKGGGQAHNHGASSSFAGNAHTNEPQYYTVVPLIYKP